MKTIYKIRRAALRQSIRICKERMIVQRAHLNLIEEMLRLDKDNEVYLTPHKEGCLLGERRRLRHRLERTKTKLEIYSQRFSLISQFLEDTE